MRELIELQSGQVAFISGLMSGFALAVAAHVLRYGIRSRVAQATFLLLLLTSLLFLLALYTETRLGIEVAGREAVPPDALEAIARVRDVGTGGATVAFFLFVLSIGLIGWLATPLTGLISTAIAAATAAALFLAWRDIGEISARLAGS